MCCLRFQNRCNRPKFNCLKRNPCFPTRCQEGVDVYPGIGRNKFVTCHNMSCQEEFCPAGLKYDKQSSKCVGTSK